ncbi:hypothetical protein Dcar01_01003 [Deinococcus carri]|uniref:Uncharacterized protein n=1 Tax=Deinococcus carri TaxID=1211323 RepID=A0ABP9W4K1_9DEIO
MTVLLVIADHVEMLCLDPNPVPGQVRLHIQLDQTQNNTFLPRRLTTLTACETLWIEGAE